MSTQTIDYDALAQQHGAAAAPVDYDALAAQHGATGEAKQAKPGWLDKEIPLDSYGAALEQGVQTVGRGVRDAVKGVGALLDPRKDENGTGFSSVGAAYPLVRMGEGLAHTAAGATEVPSVIADINQSEDPTGTYLKVGQETAGQALGQDLLALGTEGAMRAPAAVARLPLKGMVRGAGKVASAVGDAANPDLVGMFSPRAAHALKYAEKAGKVLQKVGEEAPAAEAPTAEVYRDATLNKRNIPEYAGEGEEAPAVEAGPGEEMKSRLDDLLAPEGNLLKERLGELSNPIDATVLKNRLADLRQPVHDIVDSVVPPADHGANLLTKARIDFHLAQGDVDAAQAVLEKAKPANFPPDAPRSVPSVENIRENDAMIRDAESQPGPTAADHLEDKGLSQEMNWDLEKHGYRAESEARREFIARNSTGMTKAELTRRFNAQKKPGGGTPPTSAAATPVPTPANADLKALLEQSLEMARKGKR